MKHPIPEFLLTLAEDQLAGEEAIERIPAAVWVSDNPISLAVTHEAVDSTTGWPCRLALRSPRRPTWKMLRAWKDLSKLGFVVTTNRNYRATQARMRGMGDFAS